MAIGMSMSNYSACHSAARGGGKFSGVDGGSNDSFIACVALLCTVSPIAIGTVFLVDKCSGAADRRAERRVEYQKILQDSVMFEKAEKTNSFIHFMEDHPELDIDKPNKDGETVLMKVLSKKRVISETFTLFEPNLKLAEFILNNYGDKIDYNARDNNGRGYQDILDAIENEFEHSYHSPLYFKEDKERFNELKKQFKEKAIQQHKEEVRGKTRSNTSYAFYEMMAQAKGNKKG